MLNFFFILPLLCLILVIMCQLSYEPINGQMHLLQDNKIYRRFRGWWCTCVHVAHGKLGDAPPGNHCMYHGFSD